MDKVPNEDVLRGSDEERSNLTITCHREANWIRHVLKRNCLIHARHRERSRGNPRWRGFQFIGNLSRRKYSEHWRRKIGCPLGTGQRQEEIERKIFRSSWRICRQAENVIIIMIITVNPHYWTAYISHKWAILNNLRRGSFLFAGIRIRLFFIFTILWVHMQYVHFCIQVYARLVSYVSIFSVSKTDHLLFSCYLVILNYDLFYYDELTNKR